jgi:hypothetical protein
MPGHFTTLWKLQSTSTASGQLEQEAAEYIYCARAESVKYSRQQLIETYEIHYKQNALIKAHREFE